MYKRTQKQNIILIFLLGFIISMFYFNGVSRRSTERRFNDLSKAFELAMSMTVNSIQFGYARWESFKEAAEQRDEELLEGINSEICEMQPFIRSSRIIYDNSWFMSEDYYVSVPENQMLIDFKLFDDLGNYSLEDAYLRVDVDYERVLASIQNEPIFTFYPNSKHYSGLYGKSVYRTCTYIRIYHILASLIIGGFFALVIAIIMNKLSRYFYDSRGLEKIISIFEHAERYSANHSRNVAIMANELGRLNGLKGRPLKDLRIAALLHDIGKISVPVSILNKKETLTDEEYWIIKQHSIHSAEIIEDFEELSHLAGCIRHHHEKMDGSGYPDHLKGYEIPLFSRIIAVADIFEALIGVRPYRESMTPEEALDFMKTLSLDSHFLSLLQVNYASILERIDGSGNAMLREIKYKMEFA